MLPGRREAPADRPACGPTTAGTCPCTSPGPTTRPMARSTAPRAWVSWATTPPQPRPTRQGPGLRPAHRPGRGPTGRLGHPGPGLPQRNHPQPAAPTPRSEKPCWTSPRRRALLAGQRAGSSGCCRQPPTNPKPPSWATTTGDADRRNAEHTGSAVDQLAELTLQEAAAAKPRTLQESHHAVGIGVGRPSFPGARRRRPHPRARAGHRAGPRPARPQAKPEHPPPARPAHPRAGSAHSRGHSTDRYEQPEQVHRMMRGGSSWSRTFSSSVRPSVWRACRVSSGRRRGSLDQAVPLISITTCATSAPRVISQSQPCASTPGRPYLPRFALISQLTTARLRERARRVHRTMTTFRSGS